MISLVTWVERNENEKQQAVVEMKVAQKQEKEDFQTQLLPAVQQSKVEETTAETNCEMYEKLYKENKVHLDQARAKSKAAQKVCCRVGSQTARLSERVASCPGGRE